MPRKSETDSDVGADDDEGVPLHHLARAVKAATPAREILFSKEAE